VGGHNEYDWIVWTTKETVTVMAGTIYLQMYTTSVIINSAWPSLRGYIYNNITPAVNVTKLPSTTADKVSMNKNHHPSHMVANQ